MTIPILKLDTDREKVEAILRKLRLDPAELALSRGERAKQVAAVNEIFAAVADRGDEALVESAPRRRHPRRGAQVRASIPCTRLSEAFPRSRRAKARENSCPRRATIRSRQPGDEEDAP